MPYHDASVCFFCKLISSIPNVKSSNGRTKKYQECVSKFKRKYLPDIKPDDFDYKISDFITDIIGIRAVCYHSDEVQKIRQYLKKYFKETEIVDKTDQLERTDNKFGYKSLHLQLTLEKNLKGFQDASKFKHNIIELQIRTVLQDAWSILDHKIKYKKSIPQHLGRRINRLSALFEIADDEFLSIQNEIIQQENRINLRIKKGGKIENSKMLDVFRFLFVALKYFPGYNFVEDKVDGFVQEILLFQQNFTEGELNEALQENLPFVINLEQDLKQNLNPYNKIRYCLFRHDSFSFEAILTIHQRTVYTVHLSN